jgi:hypothetical protein
MPIGNINTNSRIMAPPVGSFIDDLMQYGRQQEEKRLQEEQLAREDLRYQDQKAFRDKSYNSNLGFKTRNEERLIDKIELDRNKKLANNEAISAIVNPRRYTREQREAILNNPYVDQSKLFGIKAALYEKNAQTPGTTEFEAIKSANRNDYDWKREKDWEYKKKIADLNYTNAMNKLNAQAERKAREQRALVQSYRDILNVSPTKKVDKVINQAAIDSIERGQLIYGQAYTDFINKSNKSALEESKNKLIEKYNTITNPKDKERLAKALSNLNKDIDNIDAEADKIANEAVGSIGLQMLPKPIVEKEEVKKTPTEYVNELISKLPQNATAKDYEHVLSLKEKYFPSIDPKVEGLKKLIGRSGGKPLGTNDPNSLEMYARSLLKDSSKQTHTRQDNGEVSTKATKKALKDMVSQLGSPDVFGKNDLLNMESAIVSTKQKYNIPDNISSDWIYNLRKVYNDPIIGVDEKSFIEAYKEQAKEYIENKKK